MPSIGVVRVGADWDVGERLMVEMYVLKQMEYSLEKLDSVCRATMRIRSAVGASDAASAVELATVTVIGGTGADPALRLDRVHTVHCHGMMMRRRWGSAESLPAFLWRVR